MHMHMHPGIDKKTFRLHLLASLLWTQEAPSPLYLAKSVLAAVRTDAAGSAALTRLPLPPRGARGARGLRARSSASAAWPAPATTESATSRARP